MINEAMYLRLRVRQLLKHFLLIIELEIRDYFLRILESLHLLRKLVWLVFLVLLG